MSCKSWLVIARAWVGDFLRRLLAHPALGLVMLMSALAVPAHAQNSPEVQRGLTWLQAQVQSDGALSGELTSIATPVQTRSEAALALVALAGPSAASGPLRAKLALEPGEATEHLARKIIALQSLASDTTELSSELAQRQNVDGGFGAAIGFESNELDTAWALLAIKISKASVGDSIAGPAADYLRANQRPDGSFGLRGNSSQHLTTAVAMMALQWVPRSPPVLDVLGRSSTFLLAEQAPDGGWGNAAQTSSVYLALLGSISDPGLQSRVTGYLVAQQNAEGSWDSDPYVTALALRALSAQPRPVPTTGEIAVQIVDSSTGQPVAGAGANLQGISNLSATSNAQGKIVYLSVPAGSYTFSVSAAGYAGQSRSFVLQAGTRVDLGIISLLSAPTSGILQGVVKDAATGIGIPGALISVTGSATASATALPDGSYSIAGLAPGAVVVSAGKAGYASSVGSGTLIAGSTMTFSPALQVAQAPSTMGSISGVAQDRSTGTPLAGVFITVSGSASGSVDSLPDGSYSLGGLTPGAITITASKSGYVSVSGTGVVTAGGVLAFSPSLLADGQPSTTTGGLTGQVRDSTTGLAISGVTIAATVAGTTSTTITSVDGAYSLNGLSPGALTIIASKAGYASVRSSGSVVAGAMVLFSPSLQSTAGTLKGQAVDAATHIPLSGVTVTVGIGSITATTDSDGRFSISGIAAGAYSVSFSRIGYSTKSIASALVTAGATTELQVVALAKAAASVSISGKVIDSATSQPIVGATVTVLGAGASATTDSTGAYQINGLMTGTATLRVSAVGYAAETVIRSFDSLGEYAVDYSLNPGQGLNMTISNLSSDQAQYSAYSKASLLVEIQNSGAQASAGTVLIMIQDSHGKILDSLAATYIDANGVEQRNFNFPVGITAISLPWNTKANSPGAYTVTAKLLQVASNPALSGSIEMAAKLTTFSITPTTAIASAVLTPLPAFTNVGSNECIGFRLDIVNRSNVPVTSSYIYQVNNPTQMSVYGSSVNVSLDPQEDAKSLLLPGFQYQFIDSGLYTSTISVTEGIIPALLEGKPISVAPGTRINPLHSVAPGVVTPDGDKRIRIDIRLQGIEQK